MRRVTVVLGLALAALLVAGGALAAGSASPAALSLTWWTVDGGGQTFSQGGGYALGGTAGQPDAGALASAGYTLGGGFWRGGALVVADYPAYLPLVMRGS